MESVNKSAQIIVARPFPVNSISTIKQPVNSFSIPKHYLLQRSWHFFFF